MSRSRALTVGSRKRPRPQSTPARLRDIVLPLAMNVGRAALQYVASRSRSRRRSRVSSGARSVSVPKLPRSRVYRTTGSRVGKFRKVRKVRILPYRVFGSEKCLTYGGTTGGPDLASVGHHNAPLYEVGEAVIRGMYRRILLDNGYGFSSWDESCPLPAGVNQGMFRIIWKGFPGDTLSFSDTNIALVQSNLQVAKNIWDKFLDDVTSANEGPLLLSFEFRETSTSRWYRIDLMNAMVHMTLNSVMMLQNRTLGQTATDDQTTDVTNNPIIGRQWLLRGNQLSSNVFTDEGFSTADTRSGLIVTGAPTDFEDKLQGPTSYRYNIGSSHVKLMPGEIKKSALYSKVKMSVVNFFQMLGPYIQKASVAPPNLNTGTRIALGRSRYYTFEKMCDTDVGDQNLNLGFEINVTIGCFVALRKMQSNRIGEKI